MGIDTVKLKSPPLDEGTAVFLEQQSILKSGVDLASGEVLYEFTHGELLGSWDSRVSFRVQREEWVNLGGRLDLMPCKPHVVIEASLHKFFFGQNVYGSPERFIDSVCMFVELVSELLDLKKGLFGDAHSMFLDARRWEVRRVDWAEVYQLTPPMIVEFFRGISHCKFPRRSAKSAKYGNNAVYFPGTTTTLKLYHKGPEFKEHDRGRIRRTLTAYYMKQLAEHSSQRALGRGVANSDLNKFVERKLAALQRLADNRLRVEVEIHADKLSADFGGRFPLVSEMTDEYLKKVHDAEVFKLLREGKTEMETVRTHDMVKARLNAIYGKRRANSLFSFWLQLATRGEEVMTAEISRSQFYQNRKLLVEAAVSWLSSDVFIVPNETALPRGFVPLRSDRRLCVVPVSRLSVFNHCPVEWGALKAAA